MYTTWGGVWEGLSWKILSFYSYRNATFGAFYVLLMSDGSAFRCYIGTASPIVRQYRRSQDFVWWCTFLLQKLITFFSRLLNNLSHRPYLPISSNNWTLVLPRGGGALSAWGALTTFPCKFGQKNFLRPGGVHAPSAPPGYAYVWQACGTQHRYLEKPRYFPKPANRASLRPPQLQRYRVAVVLW